MFLCVRDYPRTTRTDQLIIPFHHTSVCYTLRKCYGAQVGGALTFSKRKSLHIATLQRLFFGELNPDDRPVGFVAFKNVTIGAEDLVFDFRAGQIGHSVAKDLPSLACFFVVQALSREDESRH